MFFGCFRRNRRSGAILIITLIVNIFIYLSLELFVKTEFEKVQRVRGFTLVTLAQKRNKCYFDVFC